MDDSIINTPILVTGAGGWLASHVVYQLLDHGYSVRGTVRSIGNSNFLFDIHPKAKERLDLRVADLLNPEPWNEVVSGCEYVVHVASPFSFNYQNEDELIKPAVEGTRAVLQAAVKNGVKRVVLTSSVCSVVFGHPPERYAADRKQFEVARQNWNKQCRAARVTPAPCEGCWMRNVEVGRDEADVHAHLHELMHCRTSNPTPATLGGWKLMTPEDFSVAANIVGYEKSKTLAEEEAWKILTNTDTELVVLCPGYIFGPIFHSRQLTGDSTEHILRTMNGRFPLVPDLKTGHVDVRDAAECHLRAIVNVAAAGRRYIITSDDGNLDFAEQSAILGNFFGRYKFHPSIIRAPNFLVKIASYFSTSARAASDKLGLLTFTNNAATHKDLGMTHWRPIEYAFVSHALSLMKYGLLKGREVPKDLYEKFEAY